jgi:hypothetical protein
MNPVTLLFYVSAATRPFDDAAVLSILNQARRNNPARDVTGCLLYSGRHFGQVLEGRVEVIDEMLRCLVIDPRHTSVKTLCRTTSATREYGVWSMGYMHSLDMQDSLEALLLADQVDVTLMERVRQAMRPDPVSGFV